MELGAGERPLERETRFEITDVGLGNFRYLLLYLVNQRWWPRLGSSPGGCPTRIKDLIDALRRGDGRFWGRANYLGPESSLSPETLSVRSPQGLIICSR
jgi:hypothetical protein